MIVQLILFYTIYRNGMKENFDVSQWSYWLQVLGNLREISGDVGALMNCKQKNANSFAIVPIWK